LCKNIRIYIGEIYEEKNQAEGSSEKLYVLAADAYYFVWHAMNVADVFCK